MKFDNCSSLEDKEPCDSWKEGYARSYDKTSCISFKNCKQLDKEILNLIKVILIIIRIPMAKVK